MRSPGSPNLTHLPRRSIALAVAFAAFAAAPGRAHAHAILKSSAPRPGATVPAGPLAISLRFNSRIDASRSRLTLLRPDGSQDALAFAAPAADMLAAETTLVPGHHVLRWQVLAIDGHITRGDLPFTVKAP
jgi:methionine-rich copper-binding protein CopC